MSQPKTVAWAENFRAQSDHESTKRNLQDLSVVRQLTFSYYNSVNARQKLSQHSRINILSMRHNQQIRLMV